jgi:hypothetical protein
MKLICITDKLKTVTKNMVYEGKHPHYYSAHSDKTGWLASCILVSCDDGTQRYITKSYFKPYDERHCERMGLCVVKDCKEDKHHYAGHCDKHMEVK